MPLFARNGDGQGLISLGDGREHIVRLLPGVEGRWVDPERTKWKKGYWVLLCDVDGVPGRVAVGIALSITIRECLGAAYEVPKGGTTIKVKRDPQAEHKKQWTVEKVSDAAP